MALLDLLVAGDVEGFNAKRGQYGSPDLFAADLADKKLRNVDLSGANLEKADLSGSDLTGAILYKANLSGADFTGTILKEVSAQRSRWREAWLEEAELDGGDFTQADFTEAVFKSVTASDAVFRNAKLSRIEASGTVMERAELDDARLKEADLSEAHLTGATLVEATLTGANLARAHLEGADFARAKVHGADLTGADLTGARFVGSDLTEANLTNADLSRADCTRADLGRSTLEGAVLAGTKLTQAGLDGHEPEQPAERGAELEGAVVDADEAPDAFHFEDVAVAVSQDAVGVLWENQEGDGSAIRVAVSPIEGPFEGGAPALRVPVDLTLAKGLVGTKDCFCGVGFVERPGGVVVMLTEVGTDGTVGKRLSVPLEYKPAVRPALIGLDDGFAIVGLARQGPTLLVHRWDGGDELKRVHAQRVAGAMGFVGRRQPVLVTRGGVVYAVHSRGASQPLQVPEGFPGRLAATARIGKRVFLAWCPRGEQGFRWAELSDRGEPTSERVAPKDGVMALDLAVSGDRVLAVYAKEDAELAVSLWGCWLGEGKPFKLVEGDVADIEELKVVGARDGKVLVLGTTISEQLELLEIGDDSCRVLTRMP